MTRGAGGRNAGNEHENEADCRDDGRNAKRCDERAPHAPHGYWGSMESSLWRPVTCRMTGPGGATVTAGTRFRAPQNTPSTPIRRLDTSNEAGGAAADHALGWDGTSSGPSNEEND